MKVDADLNLDEIDRMIHEPARLAIIVYLSILREADFTYLLHKTKLSRGNLSVQLTRLEEAGYIETEKTFVKRVPRTMVTLTDKGKKALALYKDKLRSILETTC
ncbi:MAG TPA: transcriptional regulator [Candidatus Cloacimonadota bacterium]|nr:transcriptional regulator [Candidatus Cloacimonadota bacterium]